MKKIILDTDIGTDVDDAFALILALNSPEIKVEAVTTVYGDVELRAKIASKIIQFMGKDLPVYPGVGLPLLRKREVIWKGNEGKGIIQPNDQFKHIRKENGVEMIIKKIMEDPHKVTVIAIGALTNIATAIILEPKIIQNIERLIIMGGVIGFGTNLLPTDFVEWNFKCDPEAAALTLASGMPITLVGLDVTRKVVITPKHVAMLEKSNKELLNILAKLVRIWWDTQGTEWSNMHDPLALSLTINPNFVTIKKMKLFIEDQSAKFSGLIVARDNENSRIDVATDVQAEKFMDFLFERIV